MSSTPLSTQQRTGPSSGLIAPDLRCPGEPVQLRPAAFAARVTKRPQRLGCVGDGAHRIGRATSRRPREQSLRNDGVRPTPARCGLTVGLAHRPVQRGYGAKPLVLIHRVETSAARARPARRWLNSVV